MCLGPEFISLLNPYELATGNFQQNTNITSLLHPACHLFSRKSQENSVTLLSFMRKLTFRPVIVDKIESFLIIMKSSIENIV